MILLIAERQLTLGTQNALVTQKIDNAHHMYTLVIIMTFYIQVGKVLGMMIVVSQDTDEQPPA